MPGNDLKKADVRITVDRINIVDQVRLLIKNLPIFESPCCSNSDHSEE